MRRISIGLRLAALFSLLLLAAFALLGALLWFGIESRMVAAVDSLLLDRASHLARFVEGEFGNVLVLAPGSGNRGEFRGRIEQVDPALAWIAMSGTRIAVSPNTQLEGSLRLASLRPGVFAEVEVERAGPHSPWKTRTIGVVADLRAEMKETLHEYALAAPDGPMIQMREAANGAEPAILLPSGMEGSWRPPVAWQTQAVPVGFTTVRAESGLYRLLDRELPIVGGRYRLQVAAPLALLTATRASAVEWLRFAVPFGLLLSLAGGYAISWTALRPLETFARVAGRVSASRLADRMDVPETGDAVEHLARTFNSMLDRLESSVRRLDQFTADASHELRGPVAVIRTTAELAARQNRQPAELRADMSEILAESTHLSELIDDLLTLARADASPAALATGEPIDVAALAGEVAGKFAAQARPGRISTAGASCLVQADRKELRRMLVALIDNALRHTPESASVRVATLREKESVVLSVSDTGPGIPAEELPRLFDRFSRGDPARNRSQGAGFGLGLSIAKCIAEMYGGRIAVESKMGEGSTFQVRFPAPRVTP